VAAALRVSIGLLLRRLRQVQVEGELTLPESSALARLDRGGPTTPARWPRLEQISPQSMGATLAALEARGLVERRPDPGTAGGSSCR
jgi:DNA-binding MarR family transcriptional regulator